jgi:competence protein ComEC
VRVEVLHPAAARPEASKSANDESVVLRLVYGATAILLTGDIEREAEEALVKSGVELRADVMKVPHHGSKTSSTRGFLDVVKPRYAVISVGERSRFGHPHAPVVARYRERGVELLQTGRGGMVTVQTDGTDFTVRRYRE